MRRLLRLFVGALVVMGALKVAGALARQRFPERDDPAGDDFALLAATDGREFASTATELRQGKVRIFFGGIDLDLRQAQLATGGADIDIVVVAGGIRVLVPPDVNVRVTKRVVAGGVDVELPNENGNKPELRIALAVYFGGAAIATEPSRHHVVHQQGDPA